MNTSIVIPLGSGSRWDNTELRYCLRSIVKHLSGYGDIFLIGDKPDWVQNVIHIPATDGDMTYDKERNIFNKLMIACRDERVSEEFLMVHDDHYLLKDFVAGEFPYYSDGPFAEQMSISDYKHTIANTADFFKYGHIYNAQHYDVHCPIIFNKDCAQWLHAINWEKKYGYCIKSCYCTIPEVAQSIIYKREACTDLKIRDPFPASKIMELIAGRHWFSMGDKARAGDMLEVLQSLYPTKSPYEK